MDGYHPSGNHFSIIVRERLSMDAEKDKELGQNLQKESSYRINMAEVIWGWIASQCHSVYIYNGLLDLAY